MIRRCFATLVLPVCALHTQAQPVTEIIIIAGQSNARPAYAQGIIAETIASGRHPRPTFFHRHHSGNRLENWVAGTPGHHALGPNFLTDFWSPDGSADLQKLIRQLESLGAPWDIAAFYWFQGEADSGGPTARNLYESRFFFMLDFLEIEFGLDHDIPFVITAIDYNGDDEDLARQGRTPEDIDAMRAVQFTIGQARPFGAAFDSRGWPRLDVWHVGSHADPRGMYAPVGDLGAAEVRLLQSLPVPASPADLNADGVHDLVDLQGFVRLFRGYDARVDLAAPIQVFDLNDVDAFFLAFTGR